MQEFLENKLRKKLLIKVGRSILGLILLFLLYDFIWKGFKHSLFRGYETLGNTYFVGLIFWILIMVFWEIFGYNWGIIPALVFDRIPHEDVKIRPKKVFLFIKDYFLNVKERFEIINSLLKSDFVFGLVIVSLAVCVVAIIKGG